jgi:hypothetical protein
MRVMVKRRFSHAAGEACFVTRPLTDGLPANVAVLLPMLGILDDRCGGLIVDERFFGSIGGLDSRCTVRRGRERWPWATSMMMKTGVILCTVTVWQR